MASLVASNPTCRMVLFWLTLPEKNGFLKLFGDVVIKEPSNCSHIPGFLSMKYILFWISQDCYTIHEAECLRPCTLFSIGPRHKQLDRCWCDGCDALNIIQLNDRRKLLFESLFLKAEIRKILAIVHSFLYMTLVKNKDMEL